MKGFILLLVFVTYVDLVIALSNIKSKRRSQGLVFRSTFESSEVCISLGCGSGKGYVGTKGGDCFSVKRCNKCSTTQYFSSAFSYCSTIPSLNSELTIFYGSLNSLTSFEVSNFESETSEEIGDEGKEVSDIDESDDDDDDDDDDDNDDNHKDDMLSEQITKGKNERVAKKMSISSSEVFSSSSFLQLYSQVSESSEIDDANSDIGRNKGKENDNKKYSKRIKGIFSRMFSKKNKDKQNDDLNGFSQAESTVKKNLTLKKLFKKKNKVTAKKKYEGISSKLKQVFVRKNELVEFNLKGDEIYKRIPLCPIVDGFVSITVHVFFQFYNIKKQSRLKSKRSKYPAFELIVDTKCKEDKLCTNPSKFIGRLTPHQKVVMSNSLSISAGALKSGIKQALNNARVYYRCKSPKCFPKQYNSCVKVTCATNNENKNQEWLDKQSQNFEARERELSKSISNEIKNFRDEADKVKKEQYENDYRIDVVNKMNGPLSIVDDIELHNSKVSNLEETSNENKERMDGTEGGDVLSERERKLDMESSVTEGQVVGAPTEKTASVGLDERLRRSLGTPLEEGDESNEEESNEYNVQTEDQDNEIPLQPNIPINYETDKKENKDSRNIIYITMGIVALITVLGGIIYII